MAVMHVNKYLGNRGGLRPGHGNCQHRARTPESLFVVMLHLTAICGALAKLGLSPTDLASTA